MARDDRDWWRAGHPDDHLRRLARGRSSSVGIPIYRSGRRGRPPAHRARTGLAVLVLVVGAVVGVPLLFNQDRITFEGPVAVGAIRAESVVGATVTVRISPSANLPRATVRLDGQVLPLRPNGDRDPGAGTVVLPALAPGAHSLEVSSGRTLLWRGPARRTLRFVVDATAPVLALDPVKAVASLGESVTVTGRVRDLEDDAAGRPLTVTVNGAAVPVSGGRFQLALRRPPPGGVRVAVRDAAGNSASGSLELGVARLLPALRMVHVSTDAWADASRREALLLLAAERRISAVLLDVKDPDGRIGYLSRVPLAQQVGAVNADIDLRAAVGAMKAAGLTVVGRISVFHDPVLATAAWRAGNARQVVTDRAGVPVGGAPEWTNPLDKDVRNYHLALAREAAEAGVDGVVFDRLQRPPGKIEDMDLGSAAEVDDALVEVLRGAGLVLADTPTRLGVMTEVAKDAPEWSEPPLEAFAQVSDWVLPIVYPVRWSMGSFDVVDPIANPYTIVYRALPAVRAAFGVSSARMVPVLQDFSIRLDYGRKQVAAQIQAVADRCLGDFVLWDPKVTYVARSLPVGAPVPAADKGC